MIEAYSFGSIKVKGRKYHRDIIVFPDKIRDNWWRKEGHTLSLEDIPDILEFKPEILVIGTGAMGVMKVPPEVREELEREGIRVVVERTSSAVNTFNRLLEEGKRVVGAFHLTC